MIGPPTQAEALLADAKNAVARMELTLEMYSDALANEPLDLFGVGVIEREVELAQIHRAQAHQTLRLASRLS